jgi:hypothetical protein
MKHSKLFTALMLAGLCGISDVKAKSHRNEIKSLEKQRTHCQEECIESMERLRELDFRATRKAENRDNEDETIEAEEPNNVREPLNLKSEAPQPTNPNLIKQREAEAVRAKLAAHELARIDKALRKQKARERERRSNC